MKIRNQSGTFQEREEAIDFAIANMLHNGEPGTTFVCKGLPGCSFTGLGRNDGEIAQELESCSYCTRITLDEDGILTRVDPDGPI